MSQAPPHPRFRIRIVFGPDERIGPGMADLLERIAETGSIAAAGRAMGMSYKRAWQLVETMNGMFRAPLVQRMRGGPKGGGAVLTEDGAEVLDAYRGVERQAREAGAEHLERLQALLRDIPDGK